MANSARSAGRMSSRMGLWKLCIASIWLILAGLEIALIIEEPSRASSSIV